MRLRGHPRPPQSTALWLPKTCATWADALRNAGGSVKRSASPGRPWLGRRWDDLRLVGLKLVFLVVSRVMSLLRLSRRESWWKDAEILMLRHQLAVAERERPKARARLTWPDRAWLALLAGTVPTGRMAGMRLLVTPGTILRWHRNVVRRRRGLLSRRGRSGRPATHRKVRSVVLRLAREKESWGYQRRVATVQGGPGSCDHRHRGSWPWTSSPPTSLTAPRCTSLP